jgi:predicted RNase H-like HicB family nuclease
MAAKTKAYGLYVESGPKRRKTMVHVIDLLGCIATGPTTDDALAATPGAIDAYRRFLAWHGEAIDVDAPITMRVAEHQTEGMWMGNGSPYVTFAPDLKPIAGSELEMLLSRLHAHRETLATWAASRTDKQLDSKPADGRSARSILLHVMPGPGNYLSASVGGAKGFSRVQTQAERGEVPLADAFRMVERMATELVHGTTAEQRRTVIQQPNTQRTLRKAMRRMLEHDWEHLSELSRRPGGPRL